MRRLAGIGLAALVLGWANRPAEALPDGTTVDRVALTNSEMDEF